MTEPIVYQSSRYSATRGSEKQLMKNSQDVLSWEWDYYETLAPIDSWKNIRNCAYLSWKFEWDEEEMKKNGIYGFEGVLTVRNVKKDNSNILLRFDINLTRSGKSIKKRMGTVEEVIISAGSSCIYFTFGFTLNKITDLSASDYFPDRLTPASFFNGVLVVEGHKIKVNKIYLSLRSDYFNSLFNSYFKKKSIDEIPIKDVKYGDFVCFMNAIHPTDPKPATDETAEILLELADRFMMPAVTTQVEHHLLSRSELPLEKILELADKYKFEKSLKKCLGMFKTIDHLKAFKTSFNCVNLSDSTKSKFFDILMRILE